MRLLSDESSAFPWRHTFVSISQSLAHTVNDFVKAFSILLSISPSLHDRLNVSPFGNLPGDQFHNLQSRSQFHPLAEVSLPDHISAPKHPRQSLMVSWPKDVIKSSQKVQDRA